MVTFNSRYICGIEHVDCLIDGVIRFIAIEQTSFLGGWELSTLPPTKKHLGHFDILGDIIPYIEEMDK